MTIRSRYLDHLSLCALLGSNLAFAQATGPGFALPDEMARKATGDLPEMRENKLIRALVTLDKTSFFIRDGKPQGFETELLQAYETYLNKGVRKETSKIRLVYIPMPFDRLLGALREGKGDIVAAGLTVTKSRQELVAFSNPYLPNVDEIVITNTLVDDIDSLDDLAGRKFHVLRGSSYAQHLQRLSDALVGIGLAPINIVEADENLSEEDILELVNAGIFELTVVDSHIAELWSPRFKSIDLLRNVKVNSGGRIAWAVRKDNPELIKNINTYIKKIKKGTLIGNVLFERYFEPPLVARNPVLAEERRKLEAPSALFEKYGTRYGFDWLAIAALAYQESGLDHKSKSHKGAIGIMQVKPSTAADPKINIANIEVLENNVHAAVKYLSLLRDSYFATPEIPPNDQLAFTWAAYNAGPKRVIQMRNRAHKRGLDPNRWFFNVEHAAGELVGSETVRYVANVYKYYLAYRLSADILEKKAKMRNAVPSS